MSPEWLTALATCVIALGIVFAAWQAYTAARQVRLFFYQIKADHERSRRERALDLMRYWNERSPFLVPATLIIPLITELSQAQCDRLCSKLPLTVEARFQSIIENFFFSIGFSDRLEVKDENGKITINEFQARLITTYFTNFLNVLETVACAWRHNMADRDIIEQEFYRIFFKIGADRFRFETYQKASGVYPSITEFIETVAKKKAYLEPKGKVA